MTAKEAIDNLSTRIARRDAETLLLHTVGQERPWLLAHPEAVLSPEQLTAFHSMAAQREAHTPLQYLVRHQEFFGLDLFVTPSVLIPRPETELLVEAVLHWLQRETSGAPPNPAPRIVDVGTGSGAIALALAHTLPRAELWAVDLSDAALQVASGNANRLNLHDRIRFLRSDLLDGLIRETPSEPRFDAVVSNPPYVPLADAPSLQAEVRDHEPHLALFAGPDGLEVYRRVIPQAHAALKPGGLLALEIGFGQHDALQFLLQGWTDVHFQDDYAGIPRVVLAQRPSA